VNVQAFGSAAAVAAPTLAKSTSPEINAANAVGPPRTKMFVPRPLIFKAFGMATRNGS
jgi:hypothetical protein